MDTLGSAKVFCKFSVKCPGKSLNSVEFELQTERENRKDIL